MTSHSGLWRICRYSLVPTVLANSSAARNFTTLSLNNVTSVNALKKTESKESYILDAINDIELPDPTEEITDDYRKLLFAQWVQGNTIEFEKLRNSFITLDAIQMQQQQHHQHQVSVATSKALIRNPQLMLDPTNVAAINETIGAALSTIHINGSYINVIIPEGLRHALFADWEEKPNVLLLLWAFARDMNISIAMTNSNGTRYIIQPPPPPKKGKVANGYEYKHFGMFRLSS